MLGMGQQDGKTPEQRQFLDKLKASPGVFSLLSEHSIEDVLVTQVEEI